VKHSELLAAVSGLHPIGVTGEFERHTSLRWDETRASSAGGRWGAPRAFEVLYLGRPDASVIVEAYRHLVDDDLDSPTALAASVLERRLVRFAVGVGNIVDLRSAESRRYVGLSDEALRSQVGIYGDCQAVAAAAHQLGLSGILAPAATGLGETLALFPLNVPSEEWPQVVAREIWHGLPADPRRLRAVDTG
jgi:RES domain